jgi:DnaK suppressor protein
MKRAELEQFRTALLEKRASLLDRVRALRTSEASGRDTNASDLGDKASDAINREISYELTISERDLVRRIDLALDRVDDGTFGACVHCDKTIQAARLEAVPWARHCIACQELQDRGEI